MKYKSIAVLVVAAAIFIGFTSAYIVDETEQVVITQFGRLVGEPKQEPGLYFRVPFIQNLTYFPKNLQHWDGDPGQIPTLEKTYLWVDTFARWRIADPVAFFETVNNMTSARARLDDIIGPAVRNFITSYRLIETVRSTDRELDMEEIGLEDLNPDLIRDTMVEEMDDIPSVPSTYQIVMGREQITQGILRAAQPRLDVFGIELVDVKIKRVNYVEQVRESVYNRMIAERRQIAEKFRSEGRGEARKIFGDKERDLKEITSAAYRTAQEIMGRADAEATGLYAQAYGRDAEFYSFLKTLEVYLTALEDNSSVILSTDSDFLKYLKGYDR